MLKKLTMLALLVSSATATRKLEACHKETTEEMCNTSTGGDYEDTLGNKGPNNCIWLEEPEAQGPCGTQTESQETTFTAGQAACLEATDPKTCAATDNNCVWENNIRNCTFEAQDQADCESLKESECADVFRCAWTTPSTPEGEDDPTCTYEPSIDSGAVVAIFMGVVVTALGCCGAYKLYCCLRDYRKQSPADRSQDELPTKESPQKKTPKTGLQRETKLNVTVNSTEKSESHGEGDEADTGEKVTYLQTAVSYAAAPFQMAYNSVVSAGKAVAGLVSQDEETSGQEESSDSREASSTNSRPSDNEEASTTDTPTSSTSDRV